MPGSVLEMHKRHKFTVFHFVFILSFWETGNVFVLQRVDISPHMYYNIDTDKNQ